MYKEQIVRNNMNQKTSNLQKRILTIIYSQGGREDLVSVVELNPEKVSVEYQLKKQKLVDERGGTFVREDRDTEGLLTKIYKIKACKLKRSKLACILFDWQKFILCSEFSNEIHFKVKPEDYYSREVVLTNSLKSLKAKGYVDFLDFYDNELTLLGKKQARVIWLTTKGINKAESILTTKLD